MARKTLAEERPDLVKQLVNPEDARFAPKSHKIVKVRCDRGHIRDIRMDHFTDGSECTQCLGQAAIPGVSDIATLVPQFLKWMVDPEVGGLLMPGSGKIIEWRCELGHEWFKSIRHIVQKKYWCPFCSGKKVLTGFNNIGFVFPDIAAELNDQSLADTLSPGSNKIFGWTCSNCNHEWRTAPNNRCHAGSGCPECAPTGFSPSSPGFVYIWTHGDGMDRFLKIGISNQMNTLARSFENKGVIILHRQVFNTGSEAWTLEKKLLKLINNANAIPVDQKKFESVIGEKLRGHKETFADPEGDLEELLRTHLGGFSIDRTGLDC